MFIAAPRGESQRLDGLFPKLFGGSRADAAILSGDSPGVAAGVEPELRCSRHYTTIKN
jgi:hypothetical protein